jgi:SAM-dependent methyltransferase
MKPQAILSPCKVCGGQGFQHQDVLWDALIAEWGLSNDEADYINVQQGTRCTGCGSNVRSIALAAGILCYAQSSSTLADWVKGKDAMHCKVLEVNEAGSLTGVLSQMPRHRIMCYPECDMMALSFKDASFDLVVHSDTLEHVPDPWQALRECRRILRPGGACCFTVPTVMGRLTRTRRGMPISMHGSQGCTDPSMVVHSEFGADIWCRVLEAGFRNCQMVAYGYPAGIAMVATAP